MGKLVLKIERRIKITIIIQVLSQEEIESLRSKLINLIN